MMSKSYQALRLLRPKQYLKNLALFASMFFTGQLFNHFVFWNILLGFISFCFLSSFTYIVNDISDLKKDRLHPFKRNRPISSGKLNVPEAVIIAALLLIASFFIAESISLLVLPVWLAFLIIQLLYSFIFKYFAIFDILFIASGYILRVFAGEVISGFHISAWLLLTTISLSLFLAVGKRRSELTLLKNIKDAKIEEVRKSLSHYSENMLDTFASMFASSTFIFYSLYTFLESPRGIKISLDILMPNFLPPYLQKKWLMITILPVIYGLMRYLEDIHEKSEGESPENVLLQDKSLLGAVLSWAVLALFIIYFIS